MQITRINEPSNRRPRLLRVPVPVGTPGSVGPVGAGGDHQGEQGESDTNSFVGDAIQGVGVGEKSFEIGAPPQQQKIKQVGEDSTDQRRENKRARGQAGGVKTFSVERGILAVSHAQQEEHQRQRLQQNADKDSAVGDRQQTFIFLYARRDVEHQRGKNGGEDQKHQPAQI